MDAIAGAMMNYEMLDYVELKTGVRSEGITFSVDALFKKIVTDNVGRATGNAFLEWTGYKGGYVSENIAPPERYMKYIWPMFTLAGAFDGVIWITMRSLVHYTPKDAQETERLLIARRAEMAAETPAETPPAAALPPS
jgi:Na+/melibiose symporter-like transporter